MEACVTNRFLTDPINLLFRNWIQLPALPAPRYCELRFCAVAVVRRYPLQGGYQFCAILDGMAKRVENSSAFDVCAPKPYRKAREEGPRSIDITNTIYRLVNDHFAGLDGLKQGVVKILCKPRSFLETLVIAHPHHRDELAHANPVHEIEQAEAQKKAQYLKPKGLIPRRRNAELELCPGLVPHSIVVACYHTEEILAWSEILVKSLTPPPRILPVLARALEFVAESLPLWDHQAQTCIVNFEVFHQGW